MTAYHSTRKVTRVEVKTSAWLSLCPFCVRAQVCCPGRQSFCDTYICHTHFLPAQGLGLYAARDIEKHTMVIEYIGTIIRNEVANRKEKLYESQVRSTAILSLSSCHPDTLQGRAEAAGYLGAVFWKFLLVPVSLSSRQWHLRGCDCRAVSPLHRQPPLFAPHSYRAHVSRQVAGGPTAGVVRARVSSLPAQASRRALDRGRNSARLFQNRGVYMFRMDSDHVIDATLTGGPAR